MPILEHLRKNAENLHRTLVGKEVSLMPQEVAFLARVVD
jgi:hypothetical protein